MKNVSQMPSACAGCPIILVDDEATFRLSLAEALRRRAQVFDYPAATVVPAFDDAAVEAILLTDFEMPGPTACSSPTRSGGARPAQAILLSAYTVPAVDAQWRRAPWLRFMSKPLGFDVLHALIHDR